MPVFSNPNLHADTPLRAQPRVGEWGPIGVPATRQKWRLRVWTWVAFVLGLIACTALGWYVYWLTTGKGALF